MGTPDIAIITAPRPYPTLKFMVRSMREAGFEGTIHIFSEPGPVEIEGADLKIWIHRERLGAFRNYDFALDYLMQRGSADLICALMDDYIFIPETRQALQYIQEYRDDFGYFNLHTRADQPHISEICTQEGWNRIDLGWHSWCVAYVMQRKHIPELRAAELYQKTMNEMNQHIDAAISEVFRQKGLAMFVHNPSLSFTFGRLSTIGHTSPTDGFNLRI